jgi:hypothetical protein
VCHWQHPSAQGSYESLGNRARCKLAIHQH